MPARARSPPHTHTYTHTTHATGGLLSGVHHASKNRRKWPRPNSRRRRRDTPWAADIWGTSLVDSLRDWTHSSPSLAATVLTSSSWVVVGLSRVTLGLHCGGRVLPLGHGGSDRCADHSR
jgi:hypothetical protein